MVTTSENRLWAGLWCDINGLMCDIINVKAHLSREEATVRGQGHLWGVSGRADRLTNGVAHNSAASKGSAGLDRCSSAGSVTFLEGRGEKAGTAPGGPRADGQEGQ